MLTRACALLHPPTQTPLPLLHLSPVLLQVSPQDCTGCELCVHVCPDNALTATPILDVLAPEAAKWDFMQSIPNRGELFDKSTVRHMLCHML